MSYGFVPGARTVMEPAPTPRAPTPAQRERQVREEAVALTTLLADIVGCVAPNLPETLRAELVAKLETARKGTEGLVSVAAATALRAIDKAV